MNGSERHPIYEFSGFRLDPRRRSLPSGTPLSRLAVLPFRDLSPNADDAYFAAGLHDEVLNRLAKVNALTVIGKR